MSDHPEPAPPEEVPTPFLFKVMVVLAVVYLGWRLVQGVLWVIRALGG